MGAKKNKNEIYYVNKKKPRMGIHERRRWFLEYLIVAHALSSLQSALSPRHFPQLEKEGGGELKLKIFFRRVRNFVKMIGGCYFYPTYDCFVFLPGMEQEGRGTVFFFDE